MTLDSASFVKIADLITNHKFVEIDLVKTKIVQNDTQGSVEINSSRNTADLGMIANMSTRLTVKCVKT